MLGLVGFVTIAIAGLWALIDFFLLPGLVNRRDARLAEELQSESAPLLT
jgi:hypothetical protein